MGFDYLIEIRPVLEKRKLKQKISALKEAINLKKTIRVPHLTLVYDFTPKIQNYKLADLVKETATKYETLSFEYDGWVLKETGNGFAFTFKIKPSKELREFRYELYHNIKNSIIEDPQVKNYNDASEDDFWYHASIATQLSQTKAEKIEKFTNNEKTIFEKFLKYLQGNDDFVRHKRPVLYPSEVMRIPILRSGRITYEYDKFTNRILNRSEALSRNYLRKTLDAYRKKEEIEAVPDNQTGSQSQVWLISDTHFGHSNIIGYCARPFSDVREMNSILIHNWNATVDKRDTVYFLGDIHFGYGSGSKDYWLSKLSGNIVYIRGNHDKEKQNTKPYEKLEYKGHRFLLVHDPDELPFRWDDWIIHGDKHNNNLEAYPFVNWEKKTINVCAEVIKYRPINFDKIIEIIKNEKKNNILVLGYNSIT